jgi:hypothetical protein
VELFVVSLATCVAYFAGQYLERHGVDRAGLAVASISLRVIVLAVLPAGLMKPLHAVVSHCTVHNTLREPPTGAPAHQRYRHLGSGVSVPGRRWGCRPGACRRSPASGDAVQDLDLVDV